MPPRRAFYEMGGKAGAREGLQPHPVQAVARSGADGTVLPGEAWPGINTGHLLR